jgi:hypothetical protein
MANPTGGLFETLVAAFAEAAAAPQYENVLIDDIYLQYRGISAQVGQTLQVNIPTVNEGDVNDILAGPIQPTDVAHSTVNITINHNFSTSFIIRGFDQIRTPQNLKDLYIGARREALLRKVNRQVANLITSTNLATYSTVSGGSSIFTRANLSSAWANLVGAGAPVNPRDTFFVTSQVPYGNMISDTSSTGNFVQQYVVGTPAAEMAQQRAMLVPQFNAQIQYDQQIPQPTAGSIYSAAYFHRYAFALIPVRVPIEGNSPNVEQGYVMLKDKIPARVQMWYDPTQQGWMVHLHVAFGLQTVRPEFASYLQTT